MKESKTIYLKTNIARLYFGDKEAGVITQDVEHKGVVKCWLSESENYLFVELINGDKYTYATNRLITAVCKDES